LPQKHLFILFEFSPTRCAKLRIEEFGLKLKKIRKKQYKSKSSRLQDRRSRRKKQKEVVVVKKNEYPLAATIDARFQAATGRFALGHHGRPLG
jgi:hypothetical protein